MTKTADEAIPAFRRRGIFAVLFTGQLLVVCNILLIPPVLPFITDELGLSAWQATLLLAGFPAVSLLTNLFIGPTADRVGTLRFFQLGLVLVAACFIGSALAPNGNVLIGMRLLSGLAFPMIGVTTGLFNAFGLADLSPKCNTRGGNWITRPGWGFPARKMSDSWAATRSGGCRGCIRSVAGTAVRGS